LFPKALFESDAACDEKRRHYDSWSPHPAAPNKNNILPALAVRKYVIGNLEMPIAEPAAEPLPTWPAPIVSELRHPVAH
jgi:hypothetical protein